MSEGWSIAVGVVWTLGVGLTGTLVKYRWPDGSILAALACLFAWPLALPVFLALIRLRPLGWRALRANWTPDNMPKMCTRCGSYMAREYDMDGSRWTCKLCSEVRHRLREQEEARVQAIVKEHNQFIREIHT